MIGTLKNIVTGWSKWAGLMAITPEEEALSIARMEVCGTCEYAQESKALEFLTGGAARFDTIYCTECHCPCHQKSLTNDVCPMGKWDHLKAVTNLKTT